MGKIDIVYIISEKTLAALKPSFDIGSLCFAHFKLTECFNEGCKGISVSDESEARQRKMKFQN
jgi:hypothetical protein